MKRKLYAVILILTLATTLFSCTKPAPETATQISDGDSVHIKEDFDAMESKLAEAESATAVSDTDSFTAQLESSDTDVISYEGNDDVVIDSANASEKTVDISTSGSVTLDSPAETLIVNGAEGGFTANAKAESIILEGTGITAEINSETGTILVKGKDITVNVRNSVVEKIIAVNVSAIINNLTDTDIFVTLANGTKITVPSEHTYKVSDNTLQKK